MPHAAGLYYETHGPPGGHPLILSAGLGGLGSYWAPNLQGLAQRYRTIIYDHRGTGQSDPELPQALTVEHFANDILALMDALGIGQAHVVGHALGGLAALHLAAYAPDRLAKAAVVNAWVRLDPCTARCFDVRQRILRDSGPKAYLEAQPLFLYPPTWISENSARIARDIEAQLEHFQGIATLERRIDAARGFDMDERTSHISVPVLAIAAQDDMLVPWTATDRMMAETSIVELTLKPSGGHAYNVTMPGDFNHTIFGWLPS